MSTATDDIYVKFDLAGDGIGAANSFILRVVPAWAPKGASRFLKLIDSKFYDDQRFFHCKKKGIKHNTENNNKRWYIY